MADAPLERLCRVLGVMGCQSRYTHCSVLLEEHSDAVYTSSASAVPQAVDPVLHHLQRRFWPCIVTWIFEDQCSAVYDPAVSELLVPRPD